MTAAPEMIPPLLREEIESFIWNEAGLLDDRCFEEWLALFAEDGRYWVPAQTVDPEPLGKISIFYEDKNLLAIRIRRMRHPANFAQQPFPRTSHLLGRIGVEAVPDSLYSVTSRMHVIEYREGDEKRIFAGKCLHTLRREHGQLKIVLKRVDIIDCDGPQSFITVPI
ncbi:MAG: hypothetical protein EXR27_13235 [Betaproteobacteria bacterium]|nr:hypothetical protein [Betaproteobacteria bacterium]